MYHEKGIEKTGFDKWMSVNNLVSALYLLGFVLLMIPWGEDVVLPGGEVWLYVFDFGAHLMLLLCFAFIVSSLVLFALHRLVYSGKLQFALTHILNALAALASAVVLATFQAV